MAEFIIGFVFGMVVMLAICGVIYLPMLTKIRGELLEIKIDLMNK